MSSFNKTLGITYNRLSFFETHKHCPSYPNRKSQIKISSQATDKISLHSTSMSMNSNLLMDDSYDGPMNGINDMVPRPVEIYYQFKQSSIELKSLIEEIRNLQRRKIRDAFGFNRGLEGRLNSIWEKVTLLMKGKKIFLYN